MAGAGYRSFSPNTVLTADQVQNFLMDQAVQVYADASERDTTLTGVVSEGMVAYLEDENRVYVFTGSSWEEVTPSTISANIIDSGTLNADRLPSIPSANLPVVPVTKGGTGGTTVTEGREGLEIYVQETEPSSPSAGAIWIF